MVCLLTYKIWENYELGIYELDCFVTIIIKISYDCMVLNFSQFMSCLPNGNSQCYSTEFTNQVSCKNKSQKFKLSSD